MTMVISFLLRLFLLKSGAMTDIVTHIKKCVVYAWVKDWQTKIIGHAPVEAQVEINEMIF